MSGDRMISELFHCSPQINLSTTYPLNMLGQYYKLFGNHNCSYILLHGCGHDHSSTFYSCKTIELQYLDLISTVLIHFLNKCIFSHKYKLKAESSQNEERNLCRRPTKP